LSCSASREAFDRTNSRRFRRGAPRREWPALSKRCNTAGERFPVRPEGATQITQYCVTALEKGLAIPCGLCLVLDYLGSSEYGNITLKECKSPLFAEFINLVFCLINALLPFLFAKVHDLAVSCLVTSFATFLQLGEVVF